ncbi:hypothetical protein [Massilia sp. Se16.2.3]|uniref:YybH family protein n=1 Tax=Massilia sp. Se16.2.3 TaxID=2709303 RepID=UPI001E608F2E|nr:hypothetical protein [Massilia sp. Se16.2.3]
MAFGGASSGGSGRDSGGRGGLGTWFAGARGRAQAAGLPGRARLCRNDEGARFRRLHRLPVARGRVHEPRGPQRGKEAVAVAWRPYFDKPDAPFSWEPDQVEVLDSGTLAFSSGPVRDPSGKQVGRFNSVWRLEGPGTWRVVFDRGCDCGR